MRVSIDCIVCLAGVSLLIYVVFYEFVYPLYILGVVLLAIFSADLSAYEHHRRVLGSLGLLLIFAGFVLYYVYPAIYEVLFSVGLSISLGVLSSYDFHFEKLYTSLLSVAKGFKVGAFWLFIYWIVSRVGANTLLSSLMATDYILFISAILYIVGTGFESASNSLYFGRNPASGFFYSVASMSLLIAIVGYLGHVVGLLTFPWNYIPSVLFGVFLFSLLLGVFASALIKTTPKFPAERFDFGESAYRLESPLSIIAPWGVEIQVSAKSFVLPILKHRGDEPMGIFVLGNIQYSVEDLMLGDATRGVLFLPKSEIRNVSRALLRDAPVSGFEYETIVEEARSFLEEIPQGSKHGGYEIIKMPFLEVVDGPYGEYVRVGPLTVWSSTTDTIVKVGPISIKETEHQDTQYKAYLDDVTRGLTNIVATAHQLIIDGPDYQVRKNPSALIIRRAGIKIKEKNKKLVISLKDKSITIEEFRVEIETENTQIIIEPGIIRILQNDKPITENYPQAIQVILQIRNIANELKMHILQSDYREYLIRFVSLINKILTDIA